MKKSAVMTFLCLICISAQAQNDSILYHDMQMESQWGSSTTGDQFGCFVRFTPPVYPATLTGIRAYFRDAGPTSLFRWKVYTDPGGSALGGLAMVYISSFGIPNPAAGGNPGQNYSAYVDLSASNLIIYSGDVYAGVVQSADFFGIGIDNVPNSTVAPDRQWQWMSVFGNNYWNTLTSQASSGQFGITAFFEPFSTYNPEIAENDISIVYSRSEENLLINIPEVSGNNVLRLSDISGKTLLEKNLNTSQNRFDLSGFTVGVYVVSVNGVSGAHRFKFVK